MRRTWSRAGRVSLVVGLLGALVVTAPAEAASTCLYNAAKRTITVSGDVSVLMERSGDDIVTNVGACSDGTTTATVHNTDLIKVSLTGPGVGFGIDGTNGLLTPGFIDEPGTSDEIEISMAFGSFSLFGTPGRDHIVVGTGGVNLNAREPTDDVDVSGLSAMPIVVAGGGNDIVTTRGGQGTGAGVDTDMSILGEGGNDKLLAFHVVPTGDMVFEPGPHYAMDGGPGRDRLEGGGLDDELTGGAGDDYIDGGAANDVMDGEDGNNTVAFLIGDEPVTVDLGANSATLGGDVEGIPGFSHVVGSNRGDDIEGDTGANRIEGRGGDDRLVGDTGVDQIFGQSGNDFVPASAEGEAINGGSGRDMIGYTTDVMDEVNLAAGQATGPGGGDTFTSFENATADGPVTVVGTAGPNQISSGGGAEVSAGGGNDEIFTASGVDDVNGQGGNDFIRGTGGDTQRGGPGNDTFVSATSDDTFLGGPGRDLVDFTRAFAPLTVDLRIATAQLTGAGNDRLVGIEDLTGSIRQDTFTGTSAANRLDGLFGDDLLKGEGGNDIVTGHLGEDDLYGGPGRDAVSFSFATGGVNVDLAVIERQDTNSGWDTLHQFESVIGSAFSDTLYGNGGANTLSGGGLHDQLFGRAGSDRLRGQAGNDDLYGASGADVCIGGSGVDTLHSC